MSVDLNQVLAWDDAGPVAILMFVLVCLVILVRWLLSIIFRDKDAQIVRANALVDKSTDEIGETLDQILTAMRQSADVPRDPTKGGPS